MGVLGILSIAYFIAGNNEFYQGHAMNSSGDCEGAIKYLKSAVEMMRKLKLVGQGREKLATAIYNLGLAYEIYPDNQKALQVSLIQ